MVYLFEFVDLLLELLPLMTAYFILIDDVDRPREGSFDMYGLPQLIELILFQAGRQQFILIFNAALDFSDEVGLLELDIVFFVGDGHRRLLLRAIFDSIPHNI